MDFKIKKETLSNGINKSKSINQRRGMRIKVMSCHVITVSHLWRYRLFDWHLWLIVIGQVYHRDRSLYTGPRRLDCHFGGMLPLCDLVFFFLKVRLIKWIPSAKERIIIIKSKTRQKKLKIEMTLRTELDSSIVAHVSGAD